MFGKNLDRQNFNRQISTDCVIAGGGPAGMMLGYLLARAGVDVTVLEKHKDFLRDFRGDTVHPSTLQVMQELGLLEKFLKLPHSRIRTGNPGDRRPALHHWRFRPAAHRLQIHRPDAAMGFSRFPCRRSQGFPPFPSFDGDRGERSADCRTAMSSAWRRLGKAGRSRSRPGLPSRRMAGTRPCATVPDWKSRTWARPFDVLWLRLPVLPGDPVDLVGRVKAGQVFVMIYRSDYWQCAYLIPKGGFERHQGGRACQIPRPVEIRSPVSRQAGSTKPLRTSIRSSFSP